MSFQSMRISGLLWLTLLCIASLSLAHAQGGASSSNSATVVESTAGDASASSSVTTSSVAIDVENDSANDSAGDSTDTWRSDGWRGKGWHRNELVSIGQSVTLRAGERADSVVAILGSATSEGEVRKDVVAVLGNSRITGPVGHDVVSVMGNVYINNNVGHDVVAVMGNVELGPQAVIDGELVTVGGAVSRDPAAVVRGGVQGMSLGPKFGFDWLRSWIDNCLLYGRPLAIAPGLGWAWALALLSLLFYVLTALMAPRAVDRCVTTLETSPGYSLLAALLAMLAKPILFVLLVITVIGIVAIPFLGIAVLALGFFGKLVMLVWLGRRVTGLFNSSAPDSALAHAAIATLIGGVIVTALYLVPVVGFVVYKLLGFIGFGVVVYTLILILKDKRQQGGPRTAAAAAPAPSADDAMSERPSPSSFAGSFAGDRGATSDVGAATASSIPNAAAETASQATAIDVASLPRATFWMRMGALLLDLILVAFILNLVFDLDDILLLTVAVYGALMWKLKGTTIGGILFNLRVVRVDGRELDWPTVIVRSLSCFLSLIALGLGFIWIAFDPERQAWHDKIAGTVVVRTPKGVSLV